MASGDKYKVTTPSGVNVRSGAGTNFPKVGAVPKGTVLVESDILALSGGNIWVKHNKGGWSVASSGTKVYMTKTSSAGTVNDIKGDSGKVPQENINEDSTLKGNDTGDSEGSGYMPPTDTLIDVAGTNDLENTISKASTFYNISSIVGVFGLPYQFLPTADPRLNGSASTGVNDTGIGQEYAEKIISRMPLLFLAPGRPNFMTKYAKADKENILKELLTKENINANISSLSDLLSSDGRYYTFEYALNDYYSYVNPMCRIAARYLELQDFTLGGSKLDTLDWRTYTQDNIVGLSSAKEYANVPFYIDTETSISETFDNSLTESTLASTVNGISDMGRELNFITGYSSSATNADLFTQDEEMNNAINEVNTEIQNILGKGSFLTSLSKHLSTVAKGGRLTFPKIWEDSSFSRSYNITIKLVSPDCNNLSIFLNVLVPLFHLMGFVAPQSLSTNPNGYTNPFIVKGMYKSFFNVDMGMITDMNVRKGGDCMWTVDGIPTSIEVDLTIKDLYEIMSITASKTSDWKYDTMNNTALMDYIANLCGINIYKPEIGRQLSMWFVNNFENRLLDIPKNIWSTIQQTIQKGILGIFKNY